MMSFYSLLSASGAVFPLPPLIALARNTILVRTRDYRLFVLVRWLCGLVDSPLALDASLSHGVSDVVMAWYAARLFSSLPWSCECGCTGCGDLKCDDLVHGLSSYVDATSTSCVTLMPPSSMSVSVPLRDASILEPLCEPLAVASVLRPVLASSEWLVERPALRRA